RFGLVRLRETAEEVALYRGEALEQRGLRVRFARIVDNWWDILRAQKRLTWFTTGYGQAANVFPILVAAPRYFTGAIQLGELMQIASAFGRVQDALSWFVDSYGQLAEWKASVVRVLAFADGMRGDAAEATRDEGIRTVADSPDEIALAGVDITVPAGAALLRDVNAVIRRGERVLLAGGWGGGRSRFSRPPPGLGPWGAGEPGGRATGDLLSLPQRPYLPIGSPRRAVPYPADPASVGDAAIVAALRRCRLDK